MRFQGLEHIFPERMPYDEGMARGWESKSVEEQQSVKDGTERGADSAQSKEAVAGRAERARQRQELELKRKRILAERTSSPARRAALAAALADIEDRLARLS